MPLVVKLLLLGEGIVGKVLKRKRTDPDRQSDVGTIDSIRKVVLHYLVLLAGVGVIARHIYTQILCTHPHTLLVCLFVCVRVH